MCIYTCTHMYTCIYVCVSVLLVALPYILHIPSDTLALVKFFLPTCYWYGSEHLLLYLGFFSVSICNGQKLASNQQGFTNSILKQIYANMQCIWQLLIIHCFGTAALFCFLNSRFIALFYCGYFQFSSVQFSHSVMSKSLRPHKSQHARPPCPSPTPRVHPNPCPLSWWCHPAISSLSSPSPPASNPSQHQGLFQWVSSSHEVVKVLEFQLQHQSFQWTPNILLTSFVIYLSALYKSCWERDVAQCIQKVTFAASFQCIKYCS